MDNKIAVITVVYNNYDILKDFIAGFKNQSDRNWQLFIVDLSDPDFYSRYEKELNSLPVILIHGENKGYGHGINLGLKRAIEEEHSQFIIINSDTYVSSNFIKQAKMAIDKYPGSIIGGKIYYAPGFEYHKKYKKTDLGKVIWYAGGQIDWGYVHTKHIGVDQVDKGQYDRMEFTEFITGCLMIFDDTVINTVGFWDEKYFLYYEDSDWCQKAKNIGIKLIYDPKIIIWHKNAQSTKGSGSKLHQKYQNKNRIKFGLKYAPLRTKLHLFKEALLAMFKK